MASVLPCLVSLTNCADCQCPSSTLDFYLLFSITERDFWESNDLRHKPCTLLLNQICIYRCVATSPAFLWHVYSWHRDSPQALCVMEKYSGARRAIASFLSLCLALDTARARQWKIRQSPLARVSSWVCPHTDRHLYLAEESGSGHKIFLTAFKLQLRAHYCYWTDNRLQISKSRLQLHCRPQTYNILCLLPQPRPWIVCHVGVVQL